MSSATRRVYVAAGQAMRSPLGLAAQTRPQAAAGAGDWSWAAICGAVCGRWRRTMTHAPGIRAPGFAVTACARTSFGGLLFSFATQTPRELPGEKSRAPRPCPRSRRNVATARLTRALGHLFQMVFQVPSLEYASENTQTIDKNV